MNDKTSISIAAHPEIDVRVKMKPFEFQVGGEATFSLATGDIRFRVEEIPVYVAIPFLKRRVAAGSVGPFGVHVQPFEARLHASGIDARGVLGKESSEADLHLTYDYKAKIEVSGKDAEKAVNAVINRTVKD
jgi:hypothetical protein